MDMVKKNRIKVKKYRMEKMEQELKVLEEQKVDNGLIEAVAEFRAEHKVDERVKNRIIKPDMAFFG